MGRFLITGSNSGIGLALTRRLVARGETVWAAARDPARAEDLQRLRRDAPDRVRLLQLDVTCGAALARMASDLAGVALDVLINNAGYPGPQRQDTWDVDLAGFRQALEVNTLGPLRVLQAVLPSLRLSAGAKVITISSRRGSMAYAKGGHIAYRASKSAVNKVMQVAATELRPEGIAVLVVHPGWVRTAMGSPEANIGPDESAAGVLKLIDALTVETSGEFRNYRGETVE